MNTNSSLLSSFPLGTSAPGVDNSASSAMGKNEDVDAHSNGSRFHAILDKQGQDKTDDKTEKEANLSSVDKDTGNQEDDSLKTNTDESKASFAEGVAKDQDIESLIDSEQEALPHPTPFSLSYSELKADNGKNTIQDGQRGSQAVSFLQQNSELKNAETDSKTKGSDTLSSIIKTSEDQLENGNVIPQSGKTLPGTRNASEISNTKSSLNIFQENYSAGNNVANGIVNDLSNKAIANNLLQGNQAFQLTPESLTAANLNTADQTSMPLGLSPEKSSVSLNGISNGLTSVSSAENIKNITLLNTNSNVSAQLEGKIRWMGTVNIDSAELKLHPAELGAVEIKISTVDDQATVSFVTSNSGAKEVIEESLPKLRDLLANSGLQLEQGDVSENNFSDDNSSQDSNNLNADSSDPENTELEQASLIVNRNSLNQIDHYV